MDNLQIARRYVDALVTADPERMAEVVCADVEVRYPQSGEVIVDSLLFSEVVLLGWVVGLIALTAYLFQRQDINN